MKIERYLYKNNSNNIVMEMASNTITIPKEEYELLLKCKRIVDSDFEEEFSEEFIKAIRKSEEDYKRGDFLRFKSAKEAKKYFDKA